MNQINPCLWFENEAEEAAQFYTKLFSHSRIGHKAYYGSSGSDVSGQKKGSLMTVEFELEGLKFTALNGGPIFKFSPAVSFFLWRDNEKEIDRLWSSLSLGGSIIWDLKKYPWSDKYGWCVDKYGVSWQFMFEGRNKLAPSFLFTDKLFGKGEEAIQFYTSIFKNSKIENIFHDPKTNSVMHATFTLDGQEFVLMEGNTDKAHAITPAISFMVMCKNQDEVDQFWNKLSEGGSTEQCGWLKDKYGVSWQIVPESLGQLMSDKDPARVENVMKAMLKMHKLDIEKLKQAYKAAG